MSTFIENIIFQTDYRIFKKDTYFEFSDYNIFVGNNGCGKSTLLHILHEFNNYDVLCEYDEEKCQHVETRYFDTKKMNPRTQDGRISASRSSEELHHAVLSHFCSHGESLLPILRSIQDFKNMIVFIDEPETGISLKHQLELKEIFHRMSEQNQIFIATHTVVFMKHEYILNLDKKELGYAITGDTYLQELGL